MSFQIRDVTGVIQYPVNGDKITVLDGITPNFYVVEVEPFAHSRFKAKMIEPVKAQITPLIGLDDQGVPSYGTAYTVRGDYHPEINKRWNSEMGAETVISIGHINVPCLPGEHKRKALMLHYLDKYQGLSFSNQFTVAYIEVTYPNQTWRGEMGAPVTNRIPLKPEIVEIRENFVTTDGLILKQGMAMICVSRDQITADRISNPNGYFELSTNGQAAVRYRVWNDPGREGGGGGVMFEKTHHFNIYLVKETV